jgi:hypothetical protein
MVVLKTNKGNYSDHCKGINGMKEAYLLWKGRHQNPSHFALQRYIISAELLKIRVFFNVLKNSMFFRVIRSHDSSPSPKKGWTRLNSSSKSANRSDSFFVRNGEEVPNYEGELKCFHLQEQMKSLKKVVESVGCSDGSFLLLELLADFLQDLNGTWFFLNVVNYKLEFLVNKKNSAKISGIKKRSYSTGFSKRKGKELVENSVVEKRKGLRENLVFEAVKDLMPAGENLSSSQLLYRKAYHLKIS